MDTLLNKISQLDFTPLLLSFKLAFITTLILFFIVLPLAWFLSQTKSKIKPFLEAFFALPIVLPPTVLGFYILWAFSQNSPLGEFFQKYFDISLVFSFPGIVVASCIYSLPFMLQPIQSGIESLNKSIIEASYTLGKNKIETLLRVVLPNIKPSIITALIITFAHTIGEFGVVLMVGGSIPGVTKVASIAIYEYVENLDYFSAHIYSLILLILSFIVLFFVYVYNYSKKYKEI
ncbi:molybdate ABC transporter permease subunit [Caminibacter pacificus]